LAKPKAHQIAYNTGESTIAASQIQIIKITHLIDTDLLFGSHYFGYMLACISSISFKTIQEVFHVDWPKSLAQGLIIGAIPVGALIGSTLCRTLVKRLARSYSLLI